MNRNSSLMCCVRCCSGYCLKHSCEGSVRQEAPTKASRNRRSKEINKEGEIRQPARRRAAAPPSPKPGSECSSSCLALPRRVGMCGWFCVAVDVCSCTTLLFWGVAIVFLPAPPGLIFTLPPTHAHSLPSPTPHQHRQQLQEYLEEKQQQLWQRKPRRWGWTRTGQRLEVGGERGEGGGRKNKVGVRCVCVCVCVLIFLPFQAGDYACVYWALVSWGTCRCFVSCLLALSIPPLSCLSTPHRRHHTTASSSYFHAPTLPSSHHPSLLP